MGGGSWMNMRAFDWNTGQTILIILLVMVGSFYTGTLFGKTPSLYVPQQEQEQLEKQQQLFIASNFSSLESTSGIDREKFLADAIYWQDQVCHYWRLMDVEDKEIRNVMDMNASLSGFALALSTWPVWVMNVVPVTRRRLFT